MNSQVAHIQNEWNQDQIKYSIVWEDEALLAQSLPCHRGSALTVASAGENGLSLVARGFERVVFADINVSQLALAELKLHAIHELDYDSYLGLCGFKFMDPSWRTEMSKSLIAKLPFERQETLLAQIDQFAEGLCFSGQIDRHFAKFRKHGLSALWPNLEGLISANSIPEQLVEFSTADKAKLISLVGEFFGQQGLQEAGREELQYQYAEEEVRGGQQYLRSFLRVLKSNLIKDNFYTSVFFTGGFSPNCAPPAVLTRDGFARVKSGNCSIEFRHAPLGSDLGSFDFVNASNIFEYLSSEVTNDILEQLAKDLNPWGRICFWEKSADRKPTTNLLNLSRSEDSADRVWFYKRFNCYERS